MSHFSDQQLITGLVQGDRIAFKAFIDRYKHMVYTLAIRVLRNKEDAEEIAQDTFIKALQSINGFKGEAKLSTWVYKIAYHKCLDYVKKNKSRPQTDSWEWQDHDRITASEEDWDILEAQEKRQIINRALARLPGDDGVLLTLFYFETFSLKEISGILDLSLNTVKVRLHRSRKRLAGILGKMMDEQTISMYGKK
ncbi:MAG: RNA polymerase sigma factor [Eudoraea sp.]|nr:RNA polymerase sigma factor [Eudoraea sp.]